MPNELRCIRSIRLFCALDQTNAELAGLQQKLKAREDELKKEIERIRAEATEQMERQKSDMAFRVSMLNLPKAHNLDTESFCLMFILSKESRNGDISQTSLAFHSSSQACAQSPTSQFAVAISRWSNNADAAIQRSKRRCHSYTVRRLS